LRDIVPLRRAARRPSIGRSAEVSLSVGDGVAHRNDLSGRIGRHSFPAAIPIVGHLPLDGKVISARMQPFAATSCAVSLGR